MTRAESESRDRRILVFLPGGRDADLVAEALGEAGLAGRACADVDTFCRELGAGAGTAVLAEEMLSQAVTQRLVEALGQQPPWSDFPLVIFFASGTDTAATSRRMLDILEPLGNVTILERPIRVMSLLSAIQAALRARGRQYELRDLLRRLEDAVEYRDRFLTLLAHELRNPLAAVRNAALILNQMGLLQGSLAVEQGAIIDRQTHQLSRLIDDILEVYRVTSGKFTLQRQPVDLAEVARRCREAVAREAKAQRHQVSFAVGSEPILVEGDPARLEQVIGHLLRNAVNYTSPGGRITLAVTTEGHEAVVRVRDTGVGIAAERLPMLFQPIAPTSQLLDRPQGGLGIGLALVRGLVEAHGGTVAAFSAGPHQGSEFVVRLPLVATPAVRVAGPNGGQAPATAARRILIVEDNPDGRETLCLLLQLAGHQVEVASDGVQGVKKALAMRPEAALVDIGLPGLDGYQVARQVRAALGDEVLLIAMTGYGEPHDRRRALEAGFHAHLVKPVDPEELQALLANGKRPVPAESQA
jgi:signal transduction histidine kinase/CheY-like chemotaxis protein